MLLIKLITELQALLNSYSKEEICQMGEPEIMIDRFDKIGSTHTFEYGGYSNEILIEKTDCGAYNILSTFGKTE